MVLVILLLCYYAKTEIVSMAHNKLVIIVNFPRISWDYEFDIISLAQEPKQTKSSHLEQFLSFLVPDGMNLILKTILMKTVFTAQYVS